MKYILFNLLLFTTLVTIGQNFDFHQKRLKGDTSGVISNNNFTFVITNINTFKYKINIDNKPVNNNLDIPDILKINLLNKNVDTITTLEKSNKYKDKAEIIYNFDDLVNLYLNLKSSEQFYNALLELINSDVSPENIIIYKKSYYQQFMDKNFQDDNLSVGYILKYYSDLISKININAQIIKSTLTLKEQEIVDTILKYAYKIEISNIPLKLGSLYGAINKQTFTVNYFIPKPNSDELLITIVAKPNNNYGKTSDDLKFEIPFLVKGGFKIDFSTGIFLSNISDKKYFNRPNFVNDSIKGYYLVKEDNNPISYGIAGYMHAYWRNARNINVGLTLGVGIDQNTQVKMMPGFSLILGRKERFIFNGGVVIGKCKELSIIQNETHLYNISTEPIYSEPYKIGWFGGISYNLTKK